MIEFITVNDTRHIPKTQISQHGGKIESQRYRATTERKLEFRSLVEFAKAKTTKRRDGHETHARNLPSVSSKQHWALSEREREERAKAKSRD